MNCKYISFFFAATGLMFTACDDDNWSPGPEAANPGGAFFRPIDNYSLLLEPDDNHIIEVPVTRMSSQGVLTIPLEAVNVPPGAVVPQSVSFADGQNTAYVQIDVTGLAAKSQYDLEIRIPSDMAYTYGAGSASLNLHFTMTGEWLVLADDATAYFTTWSYRDIYPEVEGKTILYLEGGFRYKIPNFAESGLDLPFVLEDTGYSCPELLPTRNADFYYWIGSDIIEGIPSGSLDYDYMEWYLYDEASQLYPVWSPDGTLPEIQFMSCYARYGYTEYRKQLLKDEDGKEWTECDVMFGGYLDFTDETSSNYFYYLWFIPKFDPEELEKQNAEQNAE